MKTLTVRLPDALLREIEHDARTRRVRISDVVRERLAQPDRAARKASDMRELLGDVIGSVSGLPTDLARNKKRYLRSLLRAKERSRG